MKISPVSEVAVCTTVRFAASGWIFCLRFAHAPADVAPTTSLVASTNLGQNLSAIIPQTGAISGLADLIAAARLGEIPAGRPNSLKGSRVDQFAIHLSGGRRLAFEANEDPVPTTIDGSIDWKQVTSIRIPFIGDHHD